MRTKTLVLSALGSFSALGLMAQSTNVYSLNAVGYINVTVPTGFSIIADQLWNSPGTANTIGTVINVPADGSWDGSQLYKFNGTGFSTYTVDSTQLPAAPWTPDGNATLNPGEAAFFKNTTGHVQTFTFVGTVPQGTNTVALGHGFNLVSSPVPQAGGISTVLGLNLDVNGSNDGDQVYVFTNPTGYQTFTVDSTQAPAPLYSPSEPSVAVGEGFFYKVGAANPTISWTRVFSVNQ